MRSTRPSTGFNLYLITDRRKSPDILQTVEKALRGGVRAVQLREKDMFSRELYELAHDMRKLTLRYGAKLFINDRADIALAVDADGVHIGADSVPLYKVRSIIGEKMMIGVSCHNMISAITAQEKGANFITFGPVFFTPSKAIYGEPVGLEKLSEVAAVVKIPVFALGGVNRSNIREVLGAGATGISLISGIVAAPDPEEEAAAILTMLPDAEPVYV